MSQNSIKKLQRVIRGGLCTRCGTCAGLSGGVVRLADREGRCLPRVEGELCEATAERIWAGCSGEEVLFDELARFTYGAAVERDAYWGHVRWTGIGYACDPDIRRRGGSAGVITRVLRALLESDQIQGAVVTDMDTVQPWRIRTYIAQTPEDILAAAQSKYVISTPNEILPAMENFEGYLAYVGLPCQVHSIRKLQQANDPAVARIRWVIGPYCGNTLHVSSIVSLLRSHGIRDYRAIARLSFRHGEWPGKTRIEMKSGRIIELPKFHANYLIPFHIMGRCLLCTDLTNEFTDISVGDAWAPVYEERGKGFSIVLGRSEQGVRLLDDLQREGALSFEQTDREDAFRMHSHGMDLKKRGAFIRIGWRRALGRPIPRYGYALGPFSVVRYGMEAVIDVIFLIARTALARRMVECLPPKTMGRLFERFRTIWKKCTRKIKRPVPPSS
jgi:coenzyme F420 hydrogenase subunit beta